MNENILKKIKSLPPLPKSVAKIRQITSDPNSSISDLVKVIKEDPMLTANLLKSANSPLYGFSRQIKSVDQAVALFGMSTIKSFALSSAIRSSIKIDLNAYGVSETQFEYVCHIQNALIVNWYRTKREKLDILSTASFLLEIGAVIISSILVSEGVADEFKRRLLQSGGNNRQELEKEFLGANTLEITAEMFNHWKFANPLVNSIKFVSNLENAGSYIKYSASLAVSYNIANMFNPLTDENIKKGLKIAKKYNLNIDNLKESIKILKKTMQK